nr:MAG TPA: hypothetical protein [Caudoviricetes sp.]
MIYNSIFPYKVIIYYILSLFQPKTPTTCQNIIFNDISLFCAILVQLAILVHIFATISARYRLKKRVKLPCNQGKPKRNRNQIVLNFEN